MKAVGTVWTNKAGYPRCYIMENIGFYSPITKEYTFEEKHNEKDQTQ